MSNKIYKVIINILPYFRGLAKHYVSKLRIGGGKLIFTKVLVSNIVLSGNYSRVAILKAAKD